MTFPLPVLEPIHWAALLIIMAVFIGAIKSSLLGVALLVISLFVPANIKLVFAIWHLVFLGVFLAWGVRFLFGQKTSFRGRRVLSFFLPLLAVMIFAMIHPGTPFKFKEHFIVWAEIPLAYMLILNSLRNGRDVRVAVRIMMVALFIFSVFYIIAQAFVAGWPASLYFSHRNFISLQLGLFLFLWLAEALSEARTRRKSLYLLLSSIPATALLLTASRWGISCFLFVLVVFLLPRAAVLNDIKIKRTLFCASIFSVLATAAIYFFNNRLTLLLFSFRLQTLQMRLDIYRAGLVFFKQHPFVGIGMGYFDYYTYYSDTHNLVLEVLVACGLIGLGAFCFLFLRLTKYFWVLSRNYCPRLRHLVYAGFAGLVFFFIRDMLDYHVEQSLGIQLGFILAIIEAAVTDKESNQLAA